MILFGRLPSYLGSFFLSLSGSAPVEHALLGGLLGEGLAVGLGGLRVDLRGLASLDLVEVGLLGLLLEDDAVVALEQGQGLDGIHQRRAVAAPQLGDVADQELHVGALVLGLALGLLGLEGLLGLDGLVHLLELLLQGVGADPIGQVEDLLLDSLGLSLEVLEAGGLSLGLLLEVLEGLLGLLPGLLVDLEVLDGGRDALAVVDDVELLVLIHVQEEIELGGLLGLSVQDGVHHRDGGLLLEGVDSGLELLDDLGAVIHRDVDLAVPQHQREVEVAVAVVGGSGGGEEVGEEVEHVCTPVRFGRNVQVLNGMFRLAAWLVMVYLMCMAYFGVHL